MNVNLYPYPTSLNHGCEAIAVSTANILNKYKVGDLWLNLTRDISNSDLGDINLLKSLYQRVEYITVPDIKRLSFDWIKYHGAKAIGKDLSIKIRKDKLIRENIEVFASSDLFLSIGGDNYCYGRPVGFYALNKYVHQIGKKSVLWGCSIEPAAIDDEMREDLLLYDNIVARESLTYEALKAKEIKNVVLYPDPAFTLPALMPETDKYDNAIGFNVSPMILEYSRDKNLVLEAWKKALIYILKETDLNIVLLPHVTVSTSDDRIILSQLYNSLECHDRVEMVDDMNCMALKGIISRCRMFIGARTHATIAAYSSCVPTLVCGYSVKAKGIAKDIFGQYENYVVPVQDISEINQLISSLRWLLDNEENIRRHLKKVMPEYIEKAWHAGEEISAISSST